MKVNIKSLLFLLIVLVSLNACQNNASYTPKPRAYPKVDFPERAYQSFVGNSCSFTFDYPVYTNINKEKNYEENAPVHPCWFNVHFPDFNGDIYVTYYEIGSPKSLDRLAKDAFELVDYHNKKANYIDEFLVDRPDSEVYGYAFNIEGPSASPFQFFVTDSVKHFVRGSIYFNTKTRPDSIAPISEFVKADALKLIESLEWSE